MRRPPRRENLLADAQCGHERAEDAYAHHREDEEDARVDDLADRALARADGDGEEDQEVREERYGRGELEDTAVRVRRDHIFLLRELHAVRDELGPAVEATGVHGAEAALHMGHDLVLRLTDDQREGEEDDEDDQESQGDVEHVVHCGPPAGSSGVGDSEVEGSGRGVSGVASAFSSSDFGAVFPGGSAPSGSGSLNAGRAWCQGASALRGASGGVPVAEAESDASSGAAPSGVAASVRCEAEPSPTLRARRGRAGAAEVADGAEGAPSPEPVPLSGVAV